MIELGSGYGLAGLVVAIATEALEVVITDGNPQVVDCILCIWNYEMFSEKKINSFNLVTY